MTIRVNSLAYSRTHYSPFYYRIRIITLFPVFFALLLLYEAYGRRSMRQELLEHNHTPTGPTDFISHVAPPTIPEERSRNAAKTLFMLPGKENRCSFQYDYICKFWFYIRCYIYAAFPNLRVLSLGADAIREFQQQATEGDIALVVWRSKNHTLMPDALAELLDWRKRTSSLSDTAPRVRIGVFHIANEVNRYGWPWYSQPDFILRNYWVPRMPPHVMYVPLGPQLPNRCTPRSTDERDAFGNNSAGCHCDGLSYKRMSKRRYAWNFSGSLRKRRAELLRKLRKSRVLRDRGYAHVSKKFGGDGMFGSVAENPKNAHLESILESQFVFAPCGNAMETHRVYEALSLGAIPVIENCEPAVSLFFPFRELLVDGGPEEMVRFVERYIDGQDGMDRLQRRVMLWWSEYVKQVSRNVSQTVQKHVPSAWKWNL